MYTCIYIQARCVRYIKIYCYMLVEYFIVRDFIVCKHWEFCRDYSLVLDNRLIVFRGLSHFWALDMRGKRMYI